MNSKIFKNSYYSIIVALILFVTHFSKLKIIGPLYLHDLVLVVVVFFALLLPPWKVYFGPIFFLGAISVCYLAISLLMPKRVPLEILIRQYAIFGYMICFAIIYSKFFAHSTIEQHVNFLIQLGKCSIVIQTIFTIVNLIRGINVLEGYNYYSPAIILALIISSSFILVYKKGFIRFFLFSFLSLLSVTTGHSSAFLSIVGVGAVFLFLNSNMNSKAISVCLTLFFLISLLFLPQFRDNNAGFRTISWIATLDRVFIDNFGFFGEGFGVPYFRNDLIMELFQKVGTQGFWIADKPYEEYVSSVHNSFLTFFIAVGVFPSLLLFYPLRKIPFYFIESKKNDHTSFLIISLFGLSIWVSFNEILEVPHSTALFWFVYFATVQSLRNEFRSMEKIGFN